MTSREPLLTPAQAGERCRICAKTVLRAIHAGRLRAYRLGEKAAYRIAIEDLEAWIEQSVVTPATPAPVSRPTAAAAARGRAAVDGTADAHAGDGGESPAAGPIGLAGP